MKDVAASRFARSLVSSALLLAVTDLPAFAADPAGDAAGNAPIEDIVISAQHLANTRNDIQPKTGAST